MDEGCVLTFPQLRKLQVVSAVTLITQIANKRLLVTLLHISGMIPVHLCTASLSQQYQS